MISDSDNGFNQIILGCRKNNRNSQNSLYRLYYAYGMSICFRYVGSEDEAITVLNDAYLKVFKNIDKFDSQQPFKPWFRKILVNTAINHIRKYKKLKMEVSMESAKNMSSEEEILSKINYEELMEIVQSLSTAYRTVFNMYVIDGFKHNEIAELLNISIGTSKSNLTRARANLRELLTQKLNSPYA